MTERCDPLSLPWLHPRRTTGRLSARVSAGNAAKRKTGEGKSEDEKTAAERDARRREEKNPKKHSAVRPGENPAREQRCGFDPNESVSAQSRD